jgi:CHAT domain-containing protein/Tfp pilus assembly protein PilF
VRPLAQLLFFLLLSFMGSAQEQPAASPSPDELIAKARQTYTQQGPKEALPEFERILTAFRGSKDRLHEAITLGYMGNCYRRLGELPRALDFVQRAMDIKQKLGDKLEIGKSHNQFGLIYWDMADYGTAIQHFQQAIALGHELGDPELEGQAHNNLGLVFDEMGDYQHSQEQYQQALQIHRVSRNERGEGDTMANIGGVHLLLGEYREALDYYGQALAIHQRIGLNPTASIELGNMGICYTALGEGEEALTTFDRALDLAQKAGLEKEQADWHKGKGEALLHLGKFGSAIAEYQQAQKVYERAGLKRELVEALNDTGNLHLTLGDLTAGETDFKRGLDLARTIGNDRGITTNLISLGDLEWRRKRYSSAENFYQDALTHSRKAGDHDRIAGTLIELALNHRELGNFAKAETEALDALQESKAAAIPPHEARSYYALAEVKLASGHLEDALQQYSKAAELEKTVRDPDLDWRIAYGRGQSLEKLGRDEEAVSAYKQSVVTIEDVRSQLAEERFRAGYLQDKYQVYVALVDLLLKLQHPDEAFSYSERLRARSFLDQLNRGIQSPLNSAQRQAEAELRERIHQLRKAIDHEWSQPVNQRRGQALDTFSKELAAAERAYQDLLDDVRRSDPTSAAMHSFAVPSIAEVQALLGPDKALLEYVIGESTLAVFVVTGSGARATSVPVSAENLQSRVELLRDLIVHQDNESWRTPAAGLRHVLISPLEKKGWLSGIRELYLVPNGVLNYLPFAVLSRTVAGRTRFLVDDYNLAYLPSAAALGLPRDGTAASRNLLAMTPERAHLKYAGQEVRDVSHFFAPATLVLIGKSATKDTFQQSAGNYQFLHLATHSFLNKYAPLLSGLELEPSGEDDGLLQVHEILDLKLHSKLVTLSACETALGSGYFNEIPAGDDFVGFTRAFLTAGSQSVLASLWEVNDRSTSELMVHFYRGLGRNDKAAALAAAQRAILRRGGLYSSPYYWAPFVLVGSMN